MAAALAVVERLEKDHCTVDAWHRELDGLGTRWSREGALDGASISRFRQLTQQLSELYAGHIQAEDNEVFPLAASNLPRSDLRAIGREMAERRGASVPSTLASSAVEPLRKSNPHDG